MNNKVYIVILNWNGWRDTIECLESVFNLDYSNYHVVVCDNGSTDSSLNYLSKWAGGEETFEQSAESPLKVKQLAQKPISYNLLQLSDIQVGCEDSENNRALSFIAVGKNLGFAGGVNVGIQYSIQDPECDLVWLLNNDTVVTPLALSKLVARMTSDEEIGICGSTLLYYDYPNRVQALGGATYYKCIAYAKHIGAHSEDFRNSDSSVIEKEMSYIVGASMMVATKVINDIGLLNQDYFLYCEEIDYCLRAKNKYKLGYSPESIVFHKEGASTGGSSRGKKEKSLTSLYYAVRSRILFTSENFPLCLPSVYLVTLFRILLLVLKGKWVAAKIVVFLLLNPRNYVKGMPHADI